MNSDGLIWIGIVFCLSQSALFSGLNLAYFSISRLQLEVEAKRGNASAGKVLRLREDSNFLLATILWGNVSINVMLTLLTDSVLLGVYAFLFSTVAITFFGEIIPQAYFSRNALRVGSLLSPVIRFYQLLFFPVAKLTSLVLDGWLGKEGITYLRERELKGIIKAHIDSTDADIEHVEGLGAINFLSVDQVLVSEEGEVVDPASVIQLTCRLDLPIVPEPNTEEFDRFVREADSSGHKWVILTDEEKEPRLALDADGFLRGALLGSQPVDPYRFCHRPVIVRDGEMTLGNAMKMLKLASENSTCSDEVLDNDVILLWTAQECRVITGADILGHLLKGIGSSQQTLSKIPPLTSSDQDASAKNT